MRSIFEDKTGVLWVGTRVGLNSVDFKRQKLKRYKRIVGDPNSLSHNEIRAIHVDKSDIVWIGTDGGGLNKLDVAKNTIKHYLHDPNNPNGLNDNVVLEIFEDKKGILWIGTYTGGLNKFDRRTGKFTHYKSDLGDPTTISSNFIRKIYESKDGYLWIGTTNGGLNKFDKENEIFTRYMTSANNPNGINSRLVTDIHEDKKGIMWLGTYNGLNKFNREENKFYHYTMALDGSKSISSNLLNSIFEDDDGFLWLGTGNGLNKFDPVAETFKVYSKRDGVSDETIYGILQDDEKRLWISTGNGLTRFDPKSEEFETFDTGDGLLDDEFSLGAFYKSSNGEMFFGGPKGLNIFHPNDMQHNQFAPTVVITDFKLFNKSVPVGKMFEDKIVLDKSISQSTSIQLSYKHNVFSFQFAALYYVQPEKYQYAYKLEGFDQDWQYTDAKNRNATYTNLNPGSYIFHVKGSNNSGVWNEQDTTITVEIESPWWDTWWFRSLASLIFVLAGYTFYRIRVDSLRKSKKVLKQMVIQRTAKIEKQKSEMVLKNAELNIKNEKIIEQAEKLRTFNDTLNSLNQNLEQRVEKRTSELKTKNKILKDHAFINSHELRKPVSNILGLIQLFDFSMNGSEKNEIIKTLKKVAANMDNKVREIQSKLGQ